MARLPDLERFAKKHDLPLISIAELIRYRRQNEKLVRLVSEARIPAEGREFRAYVYESVLDNEQHLALVMGDVAGTRRRARAGPLGVPDRRRLRLAALRLRPPAAGRARPDRGRGPGRAHLPARPRGPGHRPGPQDPGLPAARGGRTTRSTPTWQQGLPVDSREYGIGAQMLVDLGRDHHAPHDQQPGQVRRPRGLRPRHHRAGARCRRRPTRRTSPTCAPSGSAWATCCTGSTTSCDSAPADGRLGPAPRCPTGRLDDVGARVGASLQGAHDGTGLRIGHRLRPLQRRHHAAVARRRARTRSSEAGTDRTRRHGGLGPGRVRAAARGAGLRPGGQGGRRPLPRCGHPGRDRPLRLRGGGVRVGDPAGAAGDRGAGRLRRAHHRHPRAGTRAAPSPTRPTRAARRR